MNHIAETLNAELSNKSNGCDSWKSRMVGKIKECRNAIKNMMSFDMPYIYRTPTKTDSCGLKATSSGIVSFSSLALKHNEPIPTRNSSDKTKDTNCSVWIAPPAKQGPRLEFEHLNTPDVGFEKSDTKFYEDFPMNKRASSPIKNPVHTRLCT